MDVPDARNQFTFYRSYYDAIQGLGKKDQSAIILAVCAYALYEEDPKGLSPAASTAFKLIRPTLDSGRRKAASGKQGGKSGKQTESKPKANRKQTEREIEKEIEKEIEVEVEIDCSKAQATISFSEFFSAYPRQSCEDEAREIWNSIPADDLPRIMESLERWKVSEDWGEENGRYIPRACNWLSRGLWRDAPRAKLSADGRRDLNEGELEAIRRTMEEDWP